MGPPPNRCFGGPSSRAGSSPGTTGQSARRDAFTRRPGRPGVPPRLACRARCVALGGRPPFVTPLWFTPYDGVLWVTTGLGTRLAKNVGHQPEVTLLLWGERRGRPGEALRLRTRATCHAGLPPWPVLLRIAARYYLAPGALASELGNVTRWRLRARYYAQVSGGPAHVRLVPLDAELLLPTQCSKGQYVRFLSHATGTASRSCLCARASLGTGWLSVSRPMALTPPAARWWCSSTRDPGGSSSAARRSVGLRAGTRRPRALSGGSRRGPCGSAGQRPRLFFLRAPWRLQGRGLTAWACLAFQKPRKGLLRTVEGHLW